jgi:hypothetical protein
LLHESLYLYHIDSQPESGKYTLLFDRLIEGVIKVCILGTIIVALDRRISIKASKNISQSTSINGNNQTILFFA